MLQIDNDLKDMIISALRYALGRRTYITKETSDYIMEHKELLDKRVKQVMLQDLNDYFTFRRFGGYTDDECDYQSWKKLYNWLKVLEVEE